jgi:hypothetical protein
LKSRTVEIAHSLADTTVTVSVGPNAHIKAVRMMPTKIYYGAVRNTSLKCLDGAL